MKKAHLVVIGYDEIVSDKYLSIFEEAIKIGHIDGYSVIDLDSQRDEMDARIAKVRLKPENVFLVPDRRDQGVWSNSEDFGPIFQKLIAEKGRIKVYIATELKAHEGYFRYCIENGIDSLVEKPVIAPMVEGRFEPSLIESYMKYFIEKSKETNSKHSVMTLSRYHKIYNDVAIENLKKRVLEYEAPLTSFHFRTAGGVWNLHKEYESREDHPYKYGYGMIMHGAYHYVDLATQFLELNKLLMPNSDFSLTLSSYVAFPKDQNQRISKKYSKDFEDNKPDWGSTETNQTIYGETDVTSTFALVEKNTGKTITVGTISLEQTTPSIRTWREIPPDLYNKNGRISSVDLEAQLSTLYSTHVQCFDVPISENHTVDKIDAFARVSTRANASLLKNEEHITEQTHNGLFHSDSNRELILRWLKDEEFRSGLSAHLPVMKFIQALAVSTQRPGYPITFDFFNS